MNMQHRLAIVTGGNRGIGRGICLGLAQDSYSIAVVYYHQTTEAENTLRDLQSLGCNARIYQANVAVREEVIQVVSKVIKDFGSIHVLVNNAGAASKSSTTSLTEAEWDYVVDVNLKGTFLCSQAVIPYMQQQKYGRIINISSIAGQTGGGIGPHYAASKAGIIGLTRFMARELGPFGITVNSISPSGIPTELLSKIGMKPSDQRPVCRVGTPEDIAAAVSYLASESASYITGQVLSVNGGSFIG